MAYLEIWKKGKLVKRQQIDDGKAQKGCRIRLGTDSSLVLKLGESKSLAGYDVKIVEKQTEQVRPNLELSQTTYANRKSHDMASAETVDVSYPKIEGYEITGILGAGGMGAVYRATQLSTNRRVALKVLKSHTFNS
jgi:serine/threonine protein kinase